MLHAPQPLAALTAALARVERLVLLGDTVELRQGPARAALAAAEPVLAELGAAMAGREVLLVPGNHDHALARAWLDEAPRPGLEERLEPARASHWAAAVAGALAPAAVVLAYPGVWLREDVYATHGHYLDVHGTVPSLERLGAGAMARLAGAPPPRGAVPDDYERVLAPIYAWIDAAAARASPEGRSAGAGRSGELWERLEGPGRRGLRARGLRAGLGLGVLAANRAGLGPVDRDLTGPALRRGLLGGMAETLRRLGVDAPHVVFGHTHRAGPLPEDDPAEWRVGETRLHNAGSWVHERRFVGGRGASSPHWPGGAVVVDADGPPRLLRLLDGVAAEALSPPPPRG